MDTRLLADILASLYIIIEAIAGIALPPLILGLLRIDKSKNIKLNNNNESYSEKQSPNKGSSFLYIRKNYIHYNEEEYVLIMNLKRHHSRHGHSV